MTSFCRLILGPQLGESKAKSHQKNGIEAPKPRFNLDAATFLPSCPDGPLNISRQ
jgi:hypothetical protein